MVDAITDRCNISCRLQMVHRLALGDSLGDCIFPTAIRKYFFVDVHTWGHGQ